VFQAKALKLSFTNSCKRLLSKAYASGKQNLPIGRSTLAVRPAV